MCQTVTASPLSSQLYPDASKVKVKLKIRLCVAIADPPMYAESLTGAVDIRDEDDDQLGSVGDYMFTPMYTYVYDYRYRCPPAYSEVGM